MKTLLLISSIILISIFILILPAQAFVLRDNFLSSISSTYTKKVSWNTSNASFKQNKVLSSAITDNDFFGESRNSFMLKDFSSYEDLTEIVKLASMPLPERPDGIVTVAKYTSATRENCKATEDQYERLARDNPASLFLRCFEEYENANLLFSQAEIKIFPTYDVYYGGNRVARVEGDLLELDRLLNSYQLQNSELDLFSEGADNDRRIAWGEGKINSGGATPRTTARFIPGYDWNTSKGSFDDAAEKAQDSFEDMYGNWLPNMDDK